jgi:hypothetical protein
MGQEPRKATDVLLDVESKIDIVLGIIRSQDLVIKVLSNKLNDVVARLDKQQAGPPRITVETVQTPPPPSIVPPGFTNIPAGDPERTIPFLAESKLPQTQTPQGFRRNSRPETYAKDKPPAQPPEIQMPVQMPPGMRPNAGVAPPGRGNGQEVAMPPQATAPLKRGQSAVMAPPQPVGQPPIADEQAPASTGNIPVTQRCVDKNGKSIFLANVEIVDLSTGQNIFKGRTNATGKWMASLGIGGYRVTIRKLESVTKEKIEAVQDITVDGSKSRVELPMLIIK